MTGPEDAKEGREPVTNPGRTGISGPELAGAGVQFALLLVLSSFAGIWVDKQLGTSPWFLIVLVFVGAAAPLRVAAGLLADRVLSGPGDRQAVAGGGGGALGVPLGAFPVVRSLAARNLMLGWGAGAFVRVLSLAAYTVAAAKVLLLPL